MSSTTNSKTEATPASDTPPLGAKDVAAAIAKVVEVVGNLPPALQLRALGGAATALGLDKDSRSRNSTSQQRSTSSNTNSGNQNRSGGGR